MEISDRLEEVMDEFGFIYDEAESDDTLAAYSFQGQVGGQEVYSFATFTENEVSIYMNHDRFTEIPDGIYEFVNSDGYALSITLTTLKESKVRAKIIDLWAAATKFFEENP